MDEFRNESTSNRPALRRGRFRLHHQRTSRFALLVGALALAITFGTASSGASVTHASATQKASSPVTLPGADGAITLKKAPTRIISLSPTATEDLFAIGAGHQVVAVDSDSDYPTTAPKTTLSGLEPNVEAIAHYRPDLVVISYNPNGLAKALAVLHIPVLLEPAASNLSGAYSQITQLGAATGHAHQAASVVSTMKSALRRIVSEAPKEKTTLTYYYELDPTYYSATSTTFIGRIFSLFGLRDIANSASGGSDGYPQLSSEFILKANPSFIFLADTVCCDQSLKTVGTRPGWKDLVAVKDGDVVKLNDDIASRWGPRVVNLARDIEQALWARSRQH